MRNDRSERDGFRWGDPPATSAHGGPFGTPGASVRPTALRGVRRAGAAINAVLAAVLGAAVGVRVGEGTASLAPLAAAAVVLGVVGVVTGLVAWGYRHRRRRGLLPLPVVVRGIVPLAVVGATVVIFTAVGRHVGDVDLARVAIRGAPGYSTVTGPQGLPIAEGRPWGPPCEPVVFGVAAAVPDADYDQIQVVVDEARAAGVDVALETRQFRWFPADVYPAGRTDATVKFVWVAASNASPPTLAGGHAEHIGFGWDATPDAQGTHERFTDLQATLYLKAIDGPTAMRRAMRQLVAFSQAVGGTTLSGSGIADGSLVDRFTPSDLSAMRRMSGCPAVPTSEVGPGPPG